MHRFTPANVPDLPAGWEIDLYESGEHITLSLWRVRAFLQPYKDDRPDPLVYSCSRYDDADLPVGYSGQDLDDAIQELVLRAIKFESILVEYEDWSRLYPMAVDRPSRNEYFKNRRLY